MIGQTKKKIDYKDLLVSTGGPLVIYLTGLSGCYTRAMRTEVVGVGHTGIERLSLHVLFRFLLCHRWSFGLLSRAQHLEHPNKFVIEWWGVVW